jgi:hypothetical protein
MGIFESVERSDGEGENFLLKSHIQSLCFWTGVDCWTDMLTLQTSKSKPLVQGDNVVDPDGSHSCLSIISRSF